MTQKHNSKSNRLAVQQSQEEANKQTGQSSMLAMLEALAAAMEAKSEAIKELGDGRLEDLRAQFLEDVADAIRVGFNVS